MSVGSATAAWRYLRARARARVEVLRLLPAAGWRLVTAAVALQLVIGAALPLFLILMSMVVGHAEAAVSAGPGSPEANELRSILLAGAGVFALRQLLTPLEELLAMRVMLDVDCAARDRLMATSFAPDGVAILESRVATESAHDAIDALRWTEFTPGGACAGTIGLISRYEEALLAALLAGIACAWWVGVAIAATALFLRLGYRTGLGLFDRVYFDHAGPRRQRRYLQSTLLGNRAANEIRAYGLLGWFQSRHREAAVNAVRPVWDERRRIFLGPFIAYVLVGITVLGAVLAAVGREAASGVVGLGALSLAVQAALTSIRIGGFLPVDNHTEWGTLAHRAMKRFGHALESSNLESGRAAHRDPTGLPREEIRFESVTFGYPGQAEPVLRGLDLVLPAGSSLAIVGLNGVGKSTIVNLLVGMYQPHSGRITVDGIDIRDFPPERWWQRIAPVFQDFARFELPVIDNVGFGAIGLANHEARVREVLDRVGALDFVESLPDGLHTTLSAEYDGGVEPSGGLWQRIAVARALLAVEAGAGILVLDEPTASLDVSAETRFYDRFLALAGNLTTLVISHRFSTVRHADAIVVLENGLVVEKGTHFDLIDAGNAYARLFEAQASRYHQPDQRAC
jgi:ATP-binding cassette subfamily B protein